MMVHGDDKSSPPTLPFVSHSPWRMRVLVIVCLLAFPMPEGRTISEHSCVLEAERAADGEVHLQNESSRPARPAENITRQPNPAGVAMPSRFPGGGWKPGEALSQVQPWDPVVSVCASAEAMQRSTRLTGNPMRSLHPVRERIRREGRNGSVGPEGFPSTPCFS